MSCAVFTGISFYAAWQNKTNHWIVVATAAVAVFLFFVASFLTWNDEHKHLVETEIALRNEAPKLYLEYSPSQAMQFLTFSGLVVRNAGKRPAFKIVLTCDPNLKVRLRFDGIPIQRIDPDKGEPVVASTEYFGENKIWHPIGGTPGGQIESCFEWLNDRNEEEKIPVMIAYSDYESKEYMKQCVIRRDGVLFISKRIWCELV
jgi:hypothetical protein